MAEPTTPGEDELPAALPDPPRRARLPLVWILPALVIAVAGFVVIHAKLNEGTTIDISFHNADGLEANKTKVRYKEVDIGDVTDIHVAKDRKHVIVNAKIHTDAGEYLVDDTRFWVVRPRFAGGNVTGLGTLVSGSYISVDVGQSTAKRKSFEGLETPPIVTSDLPGREFILHADDIGSLQIGSSVFYRHLIAGQVVAYALDPGGNSVTIKVFINEPYDSYVASATRFWQASGIDMSINSDGVKVRTESLASILEGGVAFQTVAGTPLTAAAADTEFPLFSDQDRAMQMADVDVRSFVMYFQGSLRGLSVGAPVDVRGITIGEVKKLSVEYDRDAGLLRFPVEVDIYPRRIRGFYRHPNHSAAPEEGTEAAGRSLVDSLVAHGMRAELKTGNLLTGQKYVSMDVHPDATPDTVGWNSEPAVFPTTAGALDEIQDSLGIIVKKIGKVPFDQLSARLMTTMATLDETLKTTDHLMHQVDGTIAPQVSATLHEAQDAIKNAKDLLGQDAPLQNDLSNTLMQLSRAAKSVSALVDYLERHPESLLRGKPGDTP